MQLLAVQADFHHQVLWQACVVQTPVAKSMFTMTVQPWRFCLQTSQIRMVSTSFLGISTASQQTPGHTQQIDIFIPPVKRAVHLVAYLSSWQKPFPKLHTFCPEPSSIATLQAATFRNRPPMTECIVRCRIFSAQLVLQLTAFSPSQSSAPRLPCWRYVPWAFQEPDASPLITYRTSKAATCLAQSEFNVLMTGH